MLALHDGGVLQAKCYVQELVEELARSFAVQEAHMAEHRFSITDKMRLKPPTTHHSSNCAMVAGNSLNALWPNCSLDSERHLRSRNHSEHMRASLGRSQSIWMHSWKAWRSRRAVSLALSYHVFFKAGIRLKRGHSFSWGPSGIISGWGEGAAAAYISLRSKWLRDGDGPKAGAERPGSMRDTPAAPP